MQGCEGCAHAKVCQYKYLHNNLEDAPYRFKRISSDGTLKGGESDGE